MSGLGSFLLFALLFFVMMRFGCGAHVGHGGHDHRKQSLADDRDPVCQMPVAAGRGYGKMHAGHEYRFCSRACLDKFEADPDRYTGAVSSTSHGERAA
ncbi:MAG: YHS domain-containing protein [Steroidobacteraceae bacterium]